MNSLKILMPSGGLGSGIREDMFQNGMKMKPDVIACDGGSTDSGPAYLAKGMCKYDQMSVQHDLEICVKGAMENGIPFLIGSCGTCGTDNQVDFYAEIVLDIFKRNNLKGKIAKIYSEVTPYLIQQKWDEGKIHALPGAPKINRETFSDCTKIVSVLGAEPFIEAYQAGAAIILAGRATDTADIAAIPILCGLNEGAAWHGAKTVECGAQCTDDEEARGVMLIVDEESFSIVPIDPDAHATPYTVAAHLLYENADPNSMREPSGTIMTGNACYKQIDDVTTKVFGSEYQHAEQYTMKIEGAGIAGYQNISLVGIADKKVLEDPMKWINHISDYVGRYITKLGILQEDYSFDFKAYGYNAIIPGPIPTNAPTPREIGMLLTVTAKTQELANRVAKIFNPYLLHFPANANDILPSYAFPFSPVDTPRGPVYEFKLCHVVDVDDPNEFIRFEYIEVD